MSTATATVRIGANISGLTSGISQAKSALSSFASNVAAVAGGQALFAGLQTGLNLAVKGIRSLGTTFSEAISEAGSFESIQAQFTTFYKDTSVAASAVAELGKYANTTSFQLQDVADAGAGLASVGVPAEQLKESIRVLGDVAAGSRRPLSEILQPYIKTLSTGRFQTESFMQFLERGIPIGEQLKKSLNLDDAGLTRALSEGRVSAQQMVDALQQITTTGIFAGAAAAQGETLNGKLSTLGDAIAELKRNLGTAASTGLKPLIELASNLANAFAPLATSIGNAFTAAAQRATQFSDGFKTKFAAAVESGVKAFQIIEGAIRNGTLWDVLSASAKVAFGEVQLVAAQTLQGIQEVFEKGDVFAALGRVSDSFINTLIEAAPKIGAAFEGPVGSSLKRAADSFASYLKEQVDFAISGALDMVLPSFLSPANADMTGGGMRRAGMDTSTMPTGFASGMVSPAQAQEIAAAKAAGYPTPLTPGEVRETFAGGKRITYNTKESLVNGAIIPPANSDAFAEGTGGGGLLAIFQSGFNKQTEATVRLQQQNEKTRLELVRLIEEAKKSTVAAREQIGVLRQTAELTAKEGAAAAKEGGAAGGRGMERFTSLERIGGGRRRTGGGSSEIIPLEGREPGLRSAGTFTGGFASSPAFQKAKAEQKRQAELAKLGPVQGPPMADFIRQERQRLATPRIDFDVAPKFPLPIAGGSKIDPVVESIQRQTEVLRAQGSLNVQAI